MKILAISDIHDKWPDVSNWPQVDLVIVNGDSIPDYRIEMGPLLDKQKDAVLNRMNPWLTNVKMRTNAKEIIVCGGNHDHLFDLDRLWTEQNLAAKFIPFGRYEFKQEAGGEYTGEGTNLIRTPIYHTTNFFFSSYSYSPPHYPARWSFGQTEEGLAHLFEQIPQDTDVLVSHTPPFGCLDLGFDGKHSMKNFGSISLQRFLEESCPESLKLMICGHIHEWGGTQINFHRRRGNFFKVASVCADPYFRADSGQSPMVFSI